MTDMNSLARATAAFNASLATMAPAVQKAMAGLKECHDTIKAAHDSSPLKFHMAMWDPSQCPFCFPDED